MGTQNRGKMITLKQLHLLHELTKKDHRQCYVEWVVEGITETDVLKLKEEGYISVSFGQGYIGGLKTLSLTASGRKLIDGFCDVCECLPCDCGYGS